MPLLNFSSLSSIGRRSFQTTRPRCVWLAPVAVLAGVAPMAGGQGAQAELEQVVAPAVAAQSLRLDRLLGDLTATRPETLQGPVWTFEPQPGRELVVLPIAVDLDVSGVTYNDKSPWPVASDGDGYSLELLTPGANPDHALGYNWRSSMGIGGSPAGIIQEMSFSEWQAANFSERELADSSISGANEDPDGDGWSNYAEFSLGMAPKDAVARIVLPEAGYVESGDEIYLTFTYREWEGAKDVLYRVETSEDLVSWETGEEVLEELGTPIDYGDGTTGRAFRVKAPLSEASLKFVRLWVDEG